MNPETSPSPSLLTNEHTPINRKFRKVQSTSRLLSKNERTQIEAMDLSEGELSYREDPNNHSLFVERPKRIAGAGAVISSLFKHVALHEKTGKQEDSTAAAETVSNMRKQASFLRHALKQQYVRVKPQDFPVAVTKSAYLEIAL